MEVKLNAVLMRFSERKKYAIKTFLGVMNLSKKRNAKLTTFHASKVWSLNQFFLIQPFLEQVILGGAFIS